MYNLEEMIDRIKTIKKERKLSNEALSLLSGIPKGTLSKILGSETKDPQISNIIKIAQALGVTADYIIFGKEESKHKDDFEALFLRLNSEGQEKVIGYMCDLIDSGNYSSNTFGDTLRIYRAASSDSNHEHEIQSRSAKDMERLSKAKTVTSEEDL